MDVLVGYHYHAGDRMVAAEESWIIGIVHFEVEGKWIASDCASLVSDGPFLTLRLEKAEDEDSPYLVRSDEAIDELRESLTPDQWLAETTDDVLVLPVSTIKFHEMSLV